MMTNVGMFSCYLLVFKENMLSSVCITYSCTVSVLNFICFFLHFADYNKTAFIQDLNRHLKTSVLYCGTWYFSKCFVFHTVVTVSIIRRIRNCQFIIIISWQMFANLFIQLKSLLDCVLQDETLCMFDAVRPGARSGARSRGAARRRSSGSWARWSALQSALASLLPSPSQPSSSACLSGSAARSAA